MEEKMNRNQMLPSEYTVEDYCGSRDTDIMTQHFTCGRLYIVGEIDRDLAMHFLAALQLLADQKKPAEVVINTPGGDVDSGLLIYDAIRAYPYPLTCYCTGKAASIGAVIFAGGQHGRRFIFPHSGVMIHEPLISSSYLGNATSIEKTAQSILKIRSALNGILAEHTGKTIGEINDAVRTDCCMTAEEAVAFGICDGIRTFFEEGSA